MSVKFSDLDATSGTLAVAAGGTGVKTLADLAAAVAANGCAPINSPVFTGDPRAPTPTASDDSTSISTTAFVKAAIAAGGGGGGGTPGGATTQVQFNDGGVFGADPDFTYNKATDVLSLKNEYLYGTHIDAVNYTRVEMGFDPALGGFSIISKAAGTEVIQSISIGTNANQNLNFVTSGWSRWSVRYDGALFPSVDAENDIGVVGNTVRNIYASKVIAGIVAAPAALAANATDGFLYIPTCPGPPTAVPVVNTGCAPLVFDSANKKLCIHDGTAWRSVALA